MQVSNIDYESLIQLSYIEDQCRSCKGLYDEQIAAGCFAGNGKLLDQHDTYHRYCEACIRMVSLI